MNKIQYVVDDSFSPMNYLCVFLSIIYLLSVCIIDLQQSFV